jgi:hypothetical protein
VTVHLVQFSTGGASAEVALRVWEKAQKAGERVVLVTADTTVEDEDNWRFAREVVALMPGVEWVILCDGRTPMQAGRDARCVPNNRMAVCSRVLKRELIRKYLDQTFDPATSIVYLGYDWSEEDRLEQATAPWEPWTVECPLMEAPKLDKRQILDRLAARGITPPRLYATGASHANCGGACVRGGQVEWRRLLFWNRDRYLEWEAEEEETRTMLGKDVAILRHRSGPLDGEAWSLRDFRLAIEGGSLFDTDDEGGCGCDPWTETTAVRVELSGSEVS